MGSCSKACARNTFFFIECYMLQAAGCVLLQQRNMGATFSPIRLSLARYTDQEGRTLESKKPFISELESEGEILTAFRGCVHALHTEY